jgi:hypothetical protein
MALLASREFHARQHPRNSEHKEHSDLGHGVCQTLTSGKLRKTNIKDNTELACAPHVSNESDRECPKYWTSQQFRSPFYDEWMGTRDRLRTGLSLCSLSLGISFSSIEIAGE